MNFVHLRNLIEVADRGSLRAAARALGVAQPAISRSIQDLERELGVVLFERNRRGIRLTAIGEAFLERVRIVPQVLRSAREEVSQLRGNTAGRVAVGLSTAPHVALLPGVLRAFQHRWPDAHLEIREGMFPTMAPVLREGKIDFYVGPASEERLSSEFVSETLHANTRLVFGRVGHPLAGARSLADLAGAHWVSTSVTAHDHAELAPVFIERGLPRPIISVATHTAISMIMVVAASDLLALMPRQWTAFARDTGLLQSIPVMPEIAAPSIRIIHRTEFPLTPLARSLADLFRISALNEAAAHAASERRIGC